MRSRVRVAKRLVRLDAFARPDLLVETAPASLTVPPSTDTVGLWHHQPAVGLQRDRPGVRRPRRRRGSRSSGVTESAWSNRVWRSSSVAPASATLPWYCGNFCFATRCPLHHPSSRSSWQGSHLPCNESRRSQSNIYTHPFVLFDKALFFPLQCL